METPKPLLPVGGRPFIEYILERIGEDGHHTVVLSIGYLAEQFRSVLGDGERFGLSLEYIEDGDTPAGTAGGVRNCIRYLNDPFIVMYADSLLALQPSSLLEAHIRAGRHGTMAVMRSARGHEPANCVVVGDSVMAYSKPHSPPGATFIDYGMLAFEKSVFGDFVAPELSELQERLAELGSLTAVEVAEPYLEIGTREAMLETERKLAIKRQEFDS
jgi:NDP-sugar pyrophosphorylase family protein